MIFHAAALLRRVRGNFTRERPRCFGKKCIQIELAGIHLPAGAFPARLRRGSRCGSHFFHVCRTHRLTTYFRIVGWSHALLRRSSIVRFPAFRRKSSIVSFPAFRRRSSIVRFPAFRRRSSNVRFFAFRRNSPGVSSLIVFTLFRKRMHHIPEAFSKSVSEICGSRLFGAFCFCAHPIMPLRSFCLPAASLNPVTLYRCQGFRSLFRLFLEHSGSRGSIRLRALCLFRCRRSIFLLSPPVGRRLHPVIVLFLRWRKSRILLLELHGLHDISALTEPQNQIITGLHAFLRISRLRIQHRKLVSPALRVLPFLVFLENINLCFQRRALRLEQLILQNTARIVVFCDLGKLPEILLCIIDLIQPDADLHQTVQNISSDGRAAVRENQNILGTFIIFIYFIYIGHHVQRIDALDTAPVNRIDDIQGIFVILIPDIARQFV